MQNNMNAATQWLKEQDNTRGCITGSSLLGYFPDSHQDIDVFLYDEKAFTKLFYSMYHNEMFTLLDPLDQWKADKFMNNPFDTYHKSRILTIKFMWNVCIPVNLVLKKNCDNIFNVVSSFDLDIVCKGYDLFTKQTLDLTNGSTETKIASWNKHNTAFYNPELWQLSRVLRQLHRTFKYYNRGYNTDDAVLKYMELIDELQKTINIFTSTSYTERLQVVKQNTKIIRQICKTWLKTHEISEDEMELLQTKFKEI